MARFAHFDSSTLQPHPVIGWFDTDLFAYPEMPPASELLEVTAEQWDARMPNPSGWQMQDRTLSAISVVAPVTPPRILSSAQFLKLFTVAQTFAVWSADPQLMVGALQVIAQGSANLDSPEAKGLLDLAVAKNALTQAEATRILAGIPPTTQAAS